MIKRTSTILTSLAFSVILVSFNSCRRKGDTIARIHVKDSVGQPVSNAMVILFGEQSPPPQPHFGIIRNDTAYTDLDGWATFNYSEEYQLGQAGFAILTIYSSKDSLEGLGIIRIEPEEITNQTVVMQNQ